jgi:hypothetical protein
VARAQAGVFRPGLDRFGEAPLRSRKGLPPEGDRPQQLPELAGCRVNERKRAPARLFGFLQLAALDAQGGQACPGTGSLRIKREGSLKARLTDDQIAARDRCNGAAIPGRGFLTREHRRAYRRGVASRGRGHAAAPTRAALRGHLE